MSYRHVCISRPAKLSFENNQLIIQEIENKVPAGGQPVLPLRYAIPLEDVQSVMLEDRMSILTSYLLSKFAEFNVAVYTCDEKHVPNGLVLPFNKHSRSLKVFQKQLDMKRPLAKRLWQQIVKRKIQNQAYCLNICGKEGESELLELANRVESGDRSHIESQAAAKYFKYLFGNAFTRDDETYVNGALNYGYSIIRGLVARSLVAFGFQPAIGLQHHSELNSFNLADDFMEPYRPLIDLVVVKDLTIKKKLSSSDKHHLYGSMTRVVLLEGQKFSVSASVDAMISSFSQAISQEEPAILRLPQITQLEFISYE